MPDAPPTCRRAGLAVILAACLEAAGGGSGLLASGAAPAQHRIVRPAQRQEATPPDYSYRLTDVEALIRIRGTEDLSARRRALRNLVFGAEEIPRDLRPSSVEEGIRDARFEEIPSLRRIDRLTLVMEPGVDSKIYHLHGRGGSGSLVLYHHGHGGGFHFAVDAIRAFLDAGHDVIAMSMPLEGMNSRPVVTIPEAGTILLSSHGWLMYFDRPLRFFMEPIAAALNHALAAEPYARVAMVGFSGGGWATTLFAAMDERVSLSYPVAGTIPDYLRADLGQGSPAPDAEQAWIPLIRTANHLEMYVMGASGEGRRQVQLLNHGDMQFPHANARDSYEGIVAERVASLGPGSFRVFVDPQSRGHELSAGSLAHILADISAK